MSDQQQNVNQPRKPDESNQEQTQITVDLGTIYMNMKNVGLIDREGGNKGSAMELWSLAANLHERLAKGDINRAREILRNLQGTATQVEDLFYDAIIDAIPPTDENLDVILPQIQFVEAGASSGGDIVKDVENVAVQARGEDDQRRRDERKRKERDRRREERNRREGENKD